eukprot:c16933_g2_i2.p2 GENE.c16933_g2_i2~~c16933_g2_i2.p2  ORF type:complete len:225 (+),score=44.62 c16933_g2_i2:404-1078(+)
MASGGLTPRSPMPFPAESQQLRDQALSAMESGNFSLSCDLMKQTIAQIVHEGSLTGRHPGAVWCARYVLANRLLGRLAALRTSKADLVVIALHSQLLAEVELEARHRIPLFQVAIADNLAAQNFAVASRIIEFLLPRVKVQQSVEKLTRQLQLCEQHGKRDTHETPPPKTKQFCPETNELVSEAAFLICGRCGSVLHPSYLQRTSRPEVCPICTMPSLTKRGHA